MNHSRLLDDSWLEALINSDIWYRLCNQISDELTLKIPSPLLLIELILFPEAGSPDPFNVDRYRTRPQKIDEEGIYQLFSRSNGIVTGVIQDRLDNPTDFDLACESYCKENNIPSEIFQHRNLLDEYINQILPRANPDIDNLSKATTILSEIVSKEIDDIDSYVKQKYPDIWNEVYKAQLHQMSHKRRFSEYRYFDDLYIEAHSKQFGKEILKSYIENASNVQHHYESKKRLTARESKGFGNHQSVGNQKKSKTSNKLNAESETDVFISSCQIGNILTTRNDLISLVKNVKGITGNFDGENKKFVVTDHRILSQCLFCNRFHLQEPTRILSRYCNQQECVRSEKRWRDSLGRNGIDIKIVSPSGF